MPWDTVCTLATLDYIRSNSTDSTGFNSLLTLLIKEALHWLIWFSVDTVALKFSGIYSQTTVMLF